MPTKLEQLKARLRELRKTLFNPDRCAPFTPETGCARAEQLAAVVEEEEFRRVVVRGEFDHAHQMLLGPRSAPPGAKQHGAPGGSPSGWDIVTPLRCEDGSVVLVNRGWVPRDSTIPTRDPKTGAPSGHAFGVPAAFSQPRGTQQVHGPVLERREG